MGWMSLRDVAIPQHPLGLCWIDWVVFCVCFLVTILLLRCCLSTTYHRLLQPFPNRLITPSGEKNTDLLSRHRYLTLLRLIASCLGSLPYLCRPPVFLLGWLVPLIYLFQRNVKREYHPFSPHARGSSSFFKNWGKSVPFGGHVVDKSRTKSGCLVDGLRWFGVGGLRQVCPRGLLGSKFFGESFTFLRIFMHTCAWVGEHSSGRSC